VRARRIRILRSCRAVLALLAATNLVLAWLRATAWHSPGWSVTSAATAVFACGVIAYSTKALHLLGWRRVLGVADLPGVTWILLAGRDERARLREVVTRRRYQPMMLPVAVMERDIWGKAPGHADVPVPDATPYRNGGVITMTGVGPVGPVRPCCGTTPGTGHRGTCSQSMMNGGTEVGIADLAAPLRFPILSQDVLDEVARHLEREITRHFGIPPAHLARICECGRSPVLAQGLCGPCYRLALYAGRLPGRR